MSGTPTAEPRPGGGMRRREANLGEWQNEPYVQDVVVEMLVEAAYPLVLRDIVCTGGIPIASANRVLLRLNDRGLVTRYKLPVDRHIYCHKRKACIAWGARRMVYAYSWTGAEGERPRDDEGGDDE